jgi:toluene monooxygenase system protein E
VAQDGPFSRPARATLKTYSHLAAARRRPSDYEIGTSNLLYHPTRGFELELPFVAWYERYQRGTALTCADWESFRDPRETTYERYTAMQAAREDYLDGIACFVEHTDHDQRTPSAWIETTASVIGALRFPCHGFQMIACYLGELAPTSRIAVAAMFQAADEIRRVHWFARRLCVLRRARPEIADDGRLAWQNAVAWQPLRRAVELLLVTYDWGEALVALNVCVKPVVDELFMKVLADIAANDQADVPLAQALDSFYQDCEWQRAWTTRLITTGLAQNPALAGELSRWVGTWSSIAYDAIDGFAPLFASEFADKRARIVTRHRALLADIGVTREVGHG